MNQNLDQNSNGAQPPKKDNTLKIVLIIVGAIFGIAVIGIIGFFFLVYVIFNKSIETYNDTKDEILENYNSSTRKNNEDKTIEEDNNEAEDEKDEEGNNAAEKKQEEPQEYSNIDKLTLTEFKDLIENKRSFVIVISQTGCSHCIEYKPIYNHVLKENNINGFELDLLTLDKLEYEEFQNLLDIAGTPTTLIYIDGVVQNEKLMGTSSEVALTNFLKKYGFIK